MAQKSIGMHHLRPLNPKIFWGGPLDPPTRNNILQSSFDNSRVSPIELDITHFFAETHSDPWFYILISKCLLGVGCVISRSFLGALEV